jgi:peptidoglycan hydrolase CwlO-like protein
LSTLTKVLIVLLALSTFALCAIVSVYVATAVNWKGRYDTERRSWQSDIREMDDKVRQANDMKDKAQQRSDQLNTQVNQANIEKQTLDTKVKDLERERDQLLAQVNSWVDTVDSYTNTLKNKEKTLQETLAENKRVQAELIRLQKELDEVSESLLQERAASDDLKTENRRLAEANATLQKKVDERLAAFGREVAAAPTVTPKREVVRMPSEVTRGIDLRGLVTQVDMGDKLASISLGKADGVRVGMKFYVTRGSQFICEILITDVDTEQSVGIVNRVLNNFQPTAGDSVSTNL